MHKSICLIGATTIVAGLLAPVGAADATPGGPDRPATSRGIILPEGPGGGGGGVDPAPAKLAIRHASATELPSGNVRVTGSGTGRAGATVEVQWPNGTWAGIGNLRSDGTFENLDLSASYRFDPTNLRLRLSDQGSTSEMLIVEVETISASERAILTVSATSTRTGASVTGRASTPGDTVQAFSRGAWSSIGRVAPNGSFANSALRANQLVDGSTLRVRTIDAAGKVSRPVDATLDFAHSRVFESRPTASAKTEADRLHLRLEPADHVPTGYFAPAGTPVSIAVDGPARDIEVWIGTPGLADREDPRHAAPGPRKTRLRSGVNTVTDPHGGLIHLRNIGSPTDSLSIVTLGEGAVAAPLFVQGTTTGPAWRTMLASTRAPEVQMTGPHVVITAFLRTARLYQDADPAKTLKSHQAILDLEARAAGLDGSSARDTRTPLPFYAVESRTTFNPHATHAYIGIPHSPTKGYYMDALLTEKAVNSWVMLHEYGHHHQTNSNTYSDFGEVTVNMFSLAVAIEHDTEVTSELRHRWPGTQAFLALPTAGKSFRDAPDQMAFFDQLRRGLGSKFVLAWGKYGRANPCTATDDRGMKRCTLVSAAIAAGVDLTPFYDSWGVLDEKDTRIRSEIAALGLPRPQVDLASVEPYLKAELSR